MNVADIAKEAFDGVAAELDGVIQAASLIRTIRGAYDPTSGTFTETAQQWSGRALIADERALADIFPAYVIGPSDRLVYLEGFTESPKETDKVTIGSKAYQVTKTADIVGAGSFFTVVLRPS